MMQINTINSDSFDHEEFLRNFYFGGRLKDKYETDMFSTNVFNDAKTGVHEMKACINGEIENIVIYAWNNENTEAVAGLVVLDSDLEANRNAYCTYVRNQK